MARLRLFFATLIWIGIVVLAISVVIWSSPGNRLAALWGQMLSHSEGVKDWSAAVGSIATVLGLAIGGIFAYYRFIKGRTFVAIIDPTVSGQVTVEGDSMYLLVSATVENKGQSRVKIDTELTGVVVSARRSGGDWQVLYGRKAFTQPSSPLALEPGQTVGEQLSTDLAKNGYVALKVNLAVIPQPGRFGRQRDPWLANHIITLPPQ
jgi:hypothetical protein